MTADADATPPSELTTKTFRGIKWTYLATLTSAGMQLVFAAVMARLLDPRAFGLIAMTQLVLNFGDYFAKMGVGLALIQKLELEERDVRAGFTSSVVLGGLSSAVIWMAAPLAAGAFDEPSVVPLLRAMGLTLLLSGLGQTSQSLLRRELRFRESATIEMLSYALGYFGLGLALAAAGAGVWSLVAAALTQATLRSLLWYVRARHSLRPIFDAAVYKPLYGFGGRVSAISLLEYVGLNLDTFMVGRYAGPALLGQYSRGNLLVQVPLYQLMDSLSQVLYPSFSQIQRDPERVRRAYLTAVGAAAAVLLPLCFGMAAAAREIVLVVLGDQWLPVVTILPILAINGSFLVLTHFAGIVCEAKGELGRKLVLQAGYLVVLALLMLPALGRDLWAYALAFAVGTLLQHVAYMRLMYRILGVSLRDYAQIYGRAFAAAFATGGVILAGRQVLVALETPLLLVLAVEILLGALTLMALFRFGPLRPLALDLLGRLQREGAGDGGAIGRAVRVMVGSTTAAARSARG